MTQVSKSNLENDCEYSESLVLSTTRTDRAEIFVRQWKLASPRGAVMLAHGIGDHSGRYAHVAKTFVEAGFNVLMHDYRGHGKSKGQRGFIRNLDELWRDVEKVRKLHDDTSSPDSKGTGSSIPLFLYGHSFGGILCLNQMMRKPLRFDGLVITSPPLRVAMNAPRWKVAVGKFMRSWFPRFSLYSGIDYDNLSDDPELAARMFKDPLLHRRITPEAYFGMLEAGQWCLDNAQSLNADLPVLLMHGDSDAITDHTASIEFSNGAPNCELKIWTGGKHELHNMTWYSDVLETIINFQNKCIEKLDTQQAG